MEYPKISCLTVTKNRLILLKGAIQCFLNQTYPNKEMVIVSHGLEAFNEAVTQHLAGLPQEQTKQIRFIKLGPVEYNLGTLRNRSLDASTGSLFCHWDDDDEYHPDRLMAQYQFMKRQNARACFLMEQLHYFEEDQSLYWEDWSFNADHCPAIPITILVEKDERLRYPETGEPARTGEDAALMKQVMASMSWALLKNCGELYLYRSHGINHLSNFHHSQLAIYYAIPLSADDSKQKRLEKALPHYTLPRTIQINLHEAGAFYAFKNPGVQSIAPLLSKTLSVFSSEERDSLLPRLAEFLKEDPKEIKNIFSQLLTWTKNAVSSQTEGILSKRTRQYLKRLFADLNQKEIIR